ncbi:cleavage stimulation factor subunit 2 isoform X1 [Hippoglossus hippoglossus]|uniref:cleavage stimulation factor subunit 2 isoform X1 n=1 Tax=Hippoglossus hippoglossus TaxID=8267 RepID=UPI00148CBC08|nr:cleavage stimulation factor subunit 2 isoform X1 [Hippoglossus hippoglossus]XP_034453128.1 cleavage stimulation factor subunit 2 isoform X1 [Hippoglossus hippoglossus]
MANVAAAAAAAAAAAVAANRDPAVDRSLRSVFVGNIPYEATEEQLKDIFSEVGLVVSFRLVYDRETGKPKGYGFCEYQDQETALSAMRNLNGREFSGRALRVDNAASEKNKEELKSTCLGTGTPIIESPYGDNVQPEEAPESISRAVASLPPEQMFELMKQMKLCVQNSPQEARNMLLQNPQLSYALLQAQVVMRIVDPEIALKMLHRQTSVQPLAPSGQSGGAPPVNPPPVQPSNPVSQPQPVPGMHVNGAPQMMQPPNMGVVPGPSPGPGPGPGTGPVGPPGNLQHSPTGSSGQAAIERPPGPGGIPPRGLLGDGPNDPRGGTLLSVTGEVIEPNRGYMAAPPQHQAPPVHMSPMASGPPPDMRGPPMDMRGPPMGEPRNMIGDPRGPPMMEPRGPPMETRGRDPRAMDARGPVAAQRVPMAGAMQGPPSHSMGPNAPPPARSGSGISGAPPSGGGFSPGQSQVSTQDQEKAALIMQVLQLTPEQIAMLPPEQRQSILILKEQIQKTAGGAP